MRGVILLTRKRFEKLLMSTGIQRNTAREVSKCLNGSSFLDLWEFLSYHRQLLYIYGATENGVNALNNYRASCVFNPKRRFH